MPKRKNPDPSHFRRTKASFCPLTGPKTAIRAQNTEQAFGKKKPFSNTKNPFRPAKMSRLSAPRVRSFPKSAIRNRQSPINGPLPAQLPLPNQPQTSHSSAQKTHFRPVPDREGCKRSQTGRIADDRRGARTGVESASTGRKTAISAPKMNVAGVAQMDSASDCGSDDKSQETALTHSKTPIPSKCSTGLERTPPTDPVLTELIEVCARLSEADRGRVLGFAEGLSSKRGAR